MKSVDFIIIGQGLAGTCMAYRLIKAGKSVMVFDECKDQTASLISSGIINPITGRRYVKSWLFEKLLPVALEFYQEIGKEFNVSIISSIHLLRALKNVLEENIWAGQSGKEEYEMYIGEIEAVNELSRYFSNDALYGQINHSYQVDISALVINMREFLKKRNSFKVSNITIKDIQFGSKIKIKGTTADSIIFNEGWRVIDNPYFNNLPFDPTKGEVFITKFKSYNVDSVIKNNKFLVPQTDGTYWVGSTNETGVNSDSATPSKQDELHNFLNHNMTDDYDILKKVTAVRPSTKQRRPLIGRHPAYDNVFLLNGLGTKGASMAPYFSKMLSDHILYEKPILGEVDITKYYT